MPRLFSVLFGAFLGLALLKFGNPPIMESFVTAPRDPYEFFLGSPWPILWAYGLLGALVLLGAAVANGKPSAPLWLIALPGAWLAWECLSSFWSVSPALTRPTLVHFLACVVCFYLGLFCLGQGRRLYWLLAGLLCAFAIVLAVGWEQHFGGLEQTRRYFFLYLYPKMKQVPPELLKKMSTTRIFSTLFYPNTLAGSILLLLPVLLEFLWQVRQRFTLAARVFLIACLGGGALGCLYWSGSKGGWLLFLVLGLVWLFRQPFPPNLKRAVVVILLVGGIAGFFVRYAAFFEKGATSVGARFDYWRAALHTTAANPLVGTGPGTFAIAYAKVKRPESEMSRLAHNDYLEQGSDSGVPGLILYSVFIAGTLALSAPGFSAGTIQRPARGSTAEATPPARASAERQQAEKPPGLAAPAKSWPTAASSPRSFHTSLRFAVWLGLLGWGLQGLVEFGLYIPALAWPAFALLGLLLSRTDPTPA